MLKVKGFPIEGPLEIGLPVMVIGGTINIGLTYYLHKLNEETGMASVSRTKAGNYANYTVNVDKLCRAKFYLCDTNFEVGDSAFKIKNNFTTIVPEEAKVIDCIEKGVSSNYDRLYTGTGDAQTLIGTRDEFVKILGEISTESNVENDDTLDEKRVRPYIFYKGKLFSYNTLPMFEENVELKKDYVILFKVSCLSCKHFH